MRRFLLALLALVVLAALASPARAEPVSNTVQRVLSDKRYRFCHEDDYPLAPDEHAWCSIIGETSDACPSLPRACKLPPVPRSLSLFHRKGRHGVRWGGGAPVDRGPQLDDRRRPAEPWSLRLPDLSIFARLLFFVMIGAFVVLVGRALLQNVLKNRGDPESKGDAPPSDDAPGEAAPAARGPVETDVERLLARARAAAEHGDYGRAVDDCYAALLRRLDGDGLIEIHPSRTNGDYVRALGERPDLKGAVKDIVRDVEGVQFGDTAPSEPLYRSVLARIVPLVSRALALALVFLGLSVALSCTSHDGGGEDEGRPDTSPSGTQALVEVFEQHGVKMRRRSEPLSQLDRPLALVLLPEANLDEAAWKDVLGWVRNKGGHLVLAGVSPLPPELEQRLASDTEETTSLTVAPGVHWTGRPEVSLPAGPRLVAADPDGGAPVAGASDILDGAVLLRGGSTLVTERRLGEGKVVIVADERLFTNTALVAGDDATFALSVLYRSAIGPEREVELCDAWTGAGAQTPMESVSQAHLTPVVLQLFALMGLLFLWKGRAFARLHDPPSEGRRAFADHARALGLTYERSHAARHVTGLYAVWALDRLRERVHRAGRQGLIPLAEAIAARTGRPEGEVMSVLVEAAGARDEAAPPSSFRPEGHRGPIRDRKKKKDTSEPDLKLMRELRSFLEATGSRRARDK